MKETNENNQETKQETKQEPQKKIMISIYLEPALRGILQVLAKSMNRSVSYVAGVLIKEGLRANCQEVQHRTESVQEEKRE